MLQRLMILCFLLLTSPAWAMEHYTQVLFDNKGNAIKDATVYVYNSGTTTPATLYSDNGTTAKANPFTTSSASSSPGAYDFYAADGVYDIVFSKTGYTFNSVLTRRISLFDGTGGGGGGTSVSIDGVSVTAPNFTSTADIDFIAVGSIVTANVNADSVALGTDTTGNYAAGDAEAGAALTGDSATSFFSSGTIEDARLPTSMADKAITGSLNIPHSITLPATCVVGDQYMDTDATSGQRLYACQATNTWALQGDGGGGGAGTVTNTGGNLTANAVVLGAGTVDAKVVAGITTNGTAQLVLGVNTTALGSVKLFGNTSGDATISPSAVAGTATAITLPATSGTVALTSGNVATATALAANGANCSAGSYPLGVDASGAVEGCTVASGSGTVTVVGAGALTSTALVTGGGTTTLQTPAATATMDASGNISTPGSISTGVGGTAAGTMELTQGTAPSLGTTSVKVYSPTSVTSYGIVLPAASATGFMLGTNATNVNTVSYVGFTGTGNVVRTTGTQTSGRCVEIDASGNHIQSAAACGSGAGGTAGSTLFVQTASATAVTAASETTILSSGAGSLTIPAAWFTAAGTVMDVRFSGKYSTGAVPGTLQLKLKFGATVVGQTAAFTPIISVTDGVYSGFVRLVARTVGATGTIFVADGLLTTGSTITPGETIFSNPTLGTAVTIDTTATQVVDLTATWGTGATNSITGYTFELVGPGSAVSSVFGTTGAVANLSGDVVTSGSSVTTIQANAVALATDTTGNFVATIVDGTGITSSGSGAENATVTISVDSTKQGFLTAGALSCGASTNGKVQVHTTPLQYCDSAATPTLQYAASGTSAGAAVTNANLTGHITSTGNAAILGSFTAAQLNTAVSDADVATLAGAETLTTKTISAADNVLTLPKRIWLPAAGCNNATAGSVWDLPATSPAVAACKTGTNTQMGVLDFADAANLSAQITHKLPSTWTSTVDATIKWLTAATTGDVVWQLSTICVADAETDDPAFNTASTVTDTAKATTLQTNDAAITTVTVTGCAAGELMHLKIQRDSAHASDTLAATARLIGVELVVWEAM